MSAEFDRYDGEYEQLIAKSIGFSGKGHDFFLQRKAQLLLDLAGRKLGPPQGLSALDVGCGPGLLDRHLEAFGRLEGSDLSGAMLAEARRNNPDRAYRLSDGSELPYEPNTFDFTFAVCVMHHVPAAERSRFVAALARVTRPGGLVVVLEHNPWNPLTRLAVLRCAFDEDAHLLGMRETRSHLLRAGLEPTEERYALLVPWGGRSADVVERALARAPLGAQYYVAARS